MTGSVSTRNVHAWDRCHFSLCFSVRANDGTFNENGRGVRGRVVVMAVPIYRAVDKEVSCSFFFRVWPGEKNTFLSFFLLRFFRRRKETLGL